MRASAGTHHVMTGGHSQKGVAAFALRAGRRRRDGAAEASVDRAETTEDTERVSGAVRTQPTNRLEQTVGRVDHDGIVQGNGH
jgi:hypothetical protein